MLEKSEMTNLLKGNVNGTNACESISIGAAHARYILGEAIELDFFLLYC